MSEPRKFRAFNLIPLALLVLTSVSFSQEPDALPELLVPVSGEDRSRLRAENAKFMAARSYFAKPGKARIFRVNADLLIQPAQKFTISPDDETTIVVLSVGHQHSPTRDYKETMWVGEIEFPAIPANEFEDEDSRQAFHRVELDVAKLVFNPDLGLREPRSFGEINALKRQTVVREQPSMQVAISDPGDRPAYAIYGAIRVVDTRKSFVITPIEGIPDYHFVYEEDPQKRVFDSHGIDPNSDSGKEAKRRWEAYRQFISDLEMSEDSDSGAQENE